MHKHDYMFLVLGHYSPIAFDERVTFWLDTSSHCLAEVRILHYLLVRLAYKHYAIAHAYNAANAQAQGSDWVC